jgi:hypothetical protein
VNKMGAGFARLFALEQAATAEVWGFGPSCPAKRMKKEIQRPKTVAQSALNP